MLNKFRAAAEKAGIQATVFLKESSNKVANESRDFVQGFSLPGEAEKAAKILETFLGESACFEVSRGGLHTDNPFGPQLIQAILNPRSTPSPKRSYNTPEVLISLTHSTSDLTSYVRTRPFSFIHFLS